MAPKLERTRTPGIYRRHFTDCGGGRCDCPYVVVWKHRGRQHTATFRTLAEAREAKGERDAGDRRPVARVTFGDYFAEWIESYAGRTARGLAETSRSLYRRAVEDDALGRWRSWKLAEVEPTDVRKLYGDLRAKGASTSRLRMLRAALSAMYATAVEDGLVRSNPVAGVRIPPSRAEQLGEDAPQAKALTRSELALVLAALPAEWRLFFEFLAHTGLRISEAIGLTWQHVDLGARPRVKVREQLYDGKRRQLKSRDGRRDVPLSPRMAEKLRELRRDTFRGEVAPVFAVENGGTVNRSNLASRVLKPAVTDLGLGWVSFHSLRHTCASLLFEQGRNVRQVAEWLGHADPAYTLRTYIHLLDDGLGDAAFLDSLTPIESGIGCANPAGGDHRADRRGSRGRLSLESNSR